MHVHPRRPVPGNVAFNTKLGKPVDQPKGQWYRHTWESCAAVKNDMERTIRCFIIRVKKILKQDIQISDICKNTCVKHIYKVLYIFKDIYVCLGVFMTRKRSSELFTHLVIVDKGSGRSWPKATLILSKILKFLYRVLQYYPNG